MRPLPYRKPKLGEDFWVLDDFLPDAEAVAEAIFAREDWILGHPYRPEFWPGMRAMDALGPETLARVDAAVRDATGAKKLWQAATPDGATLNHNVAQLVGAGESGPRPHTDSRKLCTYAGVVYLTPGAPAKGGTSFYRQRSPGGALGGNFVAPPHTNLVEALGTTKVPLDAWWEDLAVPNKFNRFVFYKADLVHSASAYFGREHREKRLTALFFWMAR